MYKLADKESRMVITGKRSARKIEKELNTFAGKDEGLSFHATRIPGGFAIMCHSTIKAGPALGWVSSIADYIG